MLKRSLMFNIYLAVLLMTVVGCQTPSLDPKPDKAAEAKKKPAPENKTASGKKPSKSDISTLRLHYVMNPDGTERCLPIKLHRGSPITLHVDRTPFLHEGFVQSAEVTENLGTFEIRVQFDRTGSLLLDNMSVAWRGRNIAIYSEFTDARWLAAPLMNRRITDGVLTFTPDATREEADRIVLGLNNLARKNGTAPK